MLILLGISMVETPLLSSGWYWDSANALGLLTLAGSLYLFLFIGSGRQGRSHQLVSYGVIIAALGHVLLLWVPDKTIWHYATSDMPHYMWAGFAALLCLLATIVLALPGSRRYWHGRHRYFKSWHYYLSLAIVGLSVWHIIGSGFYFEAIEAWLLVFLAIAIAVLHRLNRSVDDSLNTSTLVATLSVTVLWLVARQI